MEWLEPWYSIADIPDHSSATVWELQRELTVGHQLYGLPVRAIARRQDCDDVLFQIDDGTGRVAVVHLTWKQGGREQPPWPATAIYPSMQVWVTEGMKPDNDEFISDDQE